MTGSIATRGIYCNPIGTAPYTGGIYCTGALAEIAEIAKLIATVAPSSMVAAVRLAADVVASVSAAGLSAKVRDC